MKMPSEYLKIAIVYGKHHSISIEIVIETKFKYTLKVEGQAQWIQQVSKILRIFAVLDHHQKITLNIFWSKHIYTQFLVEDLVLMLMKLHHFPGDQSIDIAKNCTLEMILESLNAYFYYIYVWLNNKKTHELQRTSGDCYFL